MNLGEAKKRALALMAEYSIDGALITDRENADYLNRMNFFAHDAQMEISERIGISAAQVYEQASVSQEGYNRYDLPADFKQLRKLLYNDESFVDFRILNNQLLLRKALDGKFELVYYRNPSAIDLDTPNTYEFEVDKHTHSIIPYYLGGMAIHDENTIIGDRLLNMYFNRLQNLEKKLDDYPNEFYAVYSINPF